MNMMPPVTKNILIINALCFLGMYVVEMHGINLNSLLGLHFFLADNFMPYQLLTYMFMHGGIGHLFFNMYTLYLFGSVLENIWGTKKFLTFYFITGIGAGLFNILIQHLTGNFALMIGASGAIYGILMGYAMLYPDSIMRLIFPPVALKAKWFVLIFAAIELLTGVTGTGGGIAHFAHLGGLIFGFLLIYYWKKKRTLYSRFD